MCPKQLVAKVVFDQSIFVKSAIENLLHEGGIGLILTGLMILLFLGSMRATLAVFLSIPLSALAAFKGIFVFARPSPPFLIYDPGGLRLC